MIHSRRIGDFELIRIVEFTAPTHDLEWMLPGMPRAALDANASWLEPNYWMGRTNRLVFAVQSWVLKASDRIILIDTGVGNGKKRVARYHNMVNTPAMDWLEAVGASSEKVTRVIQTHLHYPRGQRPMDTDVPERNLSRRWTGTEELQGAVRSRGTRLSREPACFRLPKPA